SGLPFVFSRSAQAEFFDKLEEFSDDSITVGGHEIPVLSLEESPAKPSAMTAPTIQLEHILPQLKIPKSKWAVLGDDSTSAAEATKHLQTAGHIAQPMNSATVMSA